MNLWTQTHPKVPKWRGPVRVHVLNDDTPEDDPSFCTWKPWTLITRSMSLRPAFKRARGCWAIRRVHG